MNFETQMQQLPKDFEIYQQEKAEEAYWDCTEIENLRDKNERLRETMDEMEAENKRLGVDNLIAKTINSI